jgi:hypothetical protein
LLKKVIFILLIVTGTLLLTSCSYTKIAAAPPKTALYISFFVDYIDLEYGQPPTYEDMIDEIKKSGYDYVGDDKKHENISVNDKSDTDHTERWNFMFMNYNDTANPNLTAVDYEIDGHDIMVVGSPFGGSLSYSCDGEDYPTYSSAELALFSPHTYNYFETGGGRILEILLVFLALCGGILGVVMIVYFFIACLAAKKIQQSSSEMAQSNAKLVEYNEALLELLQSKLAVNESDETPAAEEPKQ